MSFFSRFFFSEAKSLIEIAKIREIKNTDVIPMPKKLGAFELANNEALLNWTDGKSLYSSLLKFNSKLFTQIIVLQVVASTANMSSPIILNHLMKELQWFSSDQATWSWVAVTPMLVLASLLGLSSLIYGTSIQHYFFKSISFFQISSQMIERKIYRHSLSLSNESKQKYQIGDIVNLMNSDSDTVGNCAITTVDMINSILMVLAGSAILFYYMGWSAMVALLVMMVLGPVLQKVGKRFLHLEESMMLHRDRRMTLLAQAVNAIRVVKYFSWEKSVLKEIDAIRSQEILSRIKLIKEEVIWSLLFSSVSTVVLFTILLTHYLRGEEITLPIVMTCISVFSILDHQFGGLARFMNQFMNIFVSGKRITQFLKSETLEQYSNPVILNQERQITIRNLNFNYENGRAIFNNLNFSIQQGESVAIVGPVGSGKTTLMQLILGELNISAGQLSLPSTWKKSLVTQDAFIINASLKENILFGSSPTEESSLLKALDISGLTPDLSVLPYGIDTEIGEKGVNLSGGQKQRVTLARSVLADAELILLDDPLSAVDVRTENFLVRELLFGYWKSKTRIIATHRLSSLNLFDKVLFINEANFEFGTYDEVKSRSTQFREFIDLELKNQKLEVNLKTESTTKKNEITDEETSSRITIDEDRSVGKVKNEIFLSYFKALGGESKYRNLILLGLFILSLASVFSPVGQNWWLTKKSGFVSDQTLVVVYGILSFLTLFIVYFYTLIWSQQGIQAGKLFHDRALKSLMNTEIRFFDSTPVGRILQRFSRDVESVDVHLQWTFESTVRSLVNVVVSFLLILIALPISFVTLAPMVIYYFFLQKNYRRAAREVKRFDSVARSPKYAHFKETLQGLTVIRAFQKAEWFYQTFLNKAQTAAQAYYNHYYLNRWFSIRLPIVGSLISLGTVYAIIFSTYRGWITAGLSGLAIIYSLEFWKHLNWGIRVFSDLESRMTSVERLEFYSDLKSEKEFTDFVADPIQLDFKPSSGELIFKDVNLRYAEHLPYVLKDVSFQIPSGKKVGIIGRTGSGKSTLFQAVYRFVHFDKGDILLGGHSIRNYSLETLRKSLAVIPQDPSLFLGTLRSNLDRYNEKTDAEIYAVIDQVGMTDFIRFLPEQLNYFITENGSNLSQGQRQLICLARALLLKVKVIFLDEATASVDLETDERIQKVIHSSLNGATLVTIAHRLSTLSGYDRVIELHDGRVIRDDSLVTV